MKKYIASFLSFILAFFLLSVPVKAQGNEVTISSASASATTVSVAGTTDAVAVTIQVRNAAGTEILAMKTAGTVDGAFSTVIDGLQLSAGSYGVYVADYEGGTWATTTVTVASSAPSGNANSGNSGSGDSGNNQNNNGNSNPGAQTGTKTDDTAKKEDTSKKESVEETGTASQNTSTKKKTEETKKPAETTTTETTTTETTTTVEQPVVAEVKPEPILVKETTLQSEENWTEVSQEINNALGEALQKLEVDQEVIDAILSGDADASEVLTAPIEVKIDMGEVTEIPAAIFETIQGKNIDVVFEMTSGISWTVNGQDVSGIDFANINMEVKLDKGDIPEEKIQELAGDKEIVNLSLTHDGEFGFTATLTVNVDAKNVGKYANLYYFNPVTGEHEYMGSSLIDEDGNANLGFGHASDYTIVIDDAVPQTATVSEEEPTTEETTASVESKEEEKKTVNASDTTTQTEEDADNFLVIAIVVVVVVIVIASCVLFFTKRKKE